MVSYENEMYGDLMMEREAKRQSVLHYNNHYQDVTVFHDVLESFQTRPAEKGNKLEEMAFAICETVKRLGRISEKQKMVFIRTLISREHSLYELFPYNGYFVEEKEVKKEKIR